MLIEVALFVILLCVLYLTFGRDKCFEDADVPAERPVPLLGNMWRVTLRKTNFILESQRIYTEFGDSRTRYVGLFNFTNPVVMLKDPELIKMITVKEFDNFMERRFIDADNKESLLSKNLVNLKGQHWRDMRATLSPAFTSSKIRDMTPFVADTGKQMVEYLSKCCEENGDKDSQRVEIDLKDVTNRYMNDVIATAAFGLKMDSFTDKENYFYMMGKNLTTFGTLRTFKFMAMMTFPKLSQFFKMRLFPPEMENRFRNIFLDTMKYREENNVVRRDMIHLLMEAKKGSLKHDQTQVVKDAGFSTVEESEVGTREIKQELTDDDLAAQAILFFLAGFDTTATNMAFLLQELAANPDVQEKLQHEVDEVARKHGDSVSYDIIQHMKYLDMVISEGLRKWPPGSITDRRSVRDFDLGPATEGSKKSYTVKKGDLIWIPIYALHYDPNYWVDPYKFDPERFSDENKDSIQPFTYLPFGSGPRNCIGSRFALMEAKIMLFNIVQKFSLEVSPKACTPLELDVKQAAMRPKNGFWVILQKRNDRKLS